jgi:hypothetical protein
MFKILEMAKEKNGFILYNDIIHTVEELSDEQSGKLFKHILRYVNDKNPISEDILIKIAFEPIKQSLKRDLVKYENIRTKNKENALKRWNATACETIQTVTKNADSVSDSVSVRVIDSIEERKNKFYDSLTEYLSEYPKEMIRDFFNYWSEHGTKDKKMRYEKEKTFGVKQRLATWYNRNPKQYTETEDWKQDKVYLMAKEQGYVK